MAAETLSTKTPTTNGWERDFVAFDDLPVGWLAPRKEFFLTGFGDSQHLYAFELAPLEVSVAGGVGSITVSGAQCTECGGTLKPNNEVLLAHAQLHLAVKLAREPIKNERLSLSIDERLFDSERERQRLAAAQLIKRGTSI